jgi:hypothetical protein
MDRRTLLRGALVLPVAAAAPLALSSAAATAPPPAPGPAKRPTHRVRTWEVETLDRRLRVSPG